MRAAVFERYGPPEVIHVTDVRIPAPKDHEVLVKVHAASINPLDCVKPRGGGRLVTGLLKPIDARLGIDVAGTVEAVGKAVTQFTPGDKVFGVCIRNAEDTGIRAWISQGAFGEYACAPEPLLALKPDNVSFAHAASVPVASFTALQGLRDIGQIEPGMSVLINGAAGGVGTFAVQIAKFLGAKVTGVCSTHNVGMVRSIGADLVMDYTKEDFTKGSEQYQLILDCVGNHSPSKCINALSPSGIYVLVGDLTGRGAIRFLVRLGTAFVVFQFAARRIATFLAKPAKDDLVTMRDLLMRGMVRPVIDRCYGLEEIVDAFRYVEGRHARGKVVLTMVPGTAR